MSILGVDVGMALFVSIALAELILDDWILTKEELEFQSHLRRSFCDKFLCHALAEPKFQSRLQAFILRPKWHCLAIKREFQSHLQALILRRSCTQMV